MDNEDPFQKTVSPAMKLLPFRVRVNPVPPIIALEGRSEPRTGAGGAVIVKFITFEFGVIAD